MTNESHTDWWNQYLESDDPDHVVVQMDKEIELLRDQRDSNMAKEVERIASLTTQRDEYKVWWERDSTSLGKALNEVSSLRAVREESRAAIEQLHAAVKTAQELAATRLMEIDKLRAALQTIVDFSDSAMGDGDGARDVARTALRAHAHEPLPCATRESDWCCTHCGRDNDPTESHCVHCEWSRKHTVAGVLHERGCEDNPCRCGALKSPGASRDASSTYRGYPDGTCQECGQVLGDHVCPTLRTFE